MPSFYHKRVSSSAPDEYKNEYDSLELETQQLLSQIKNDRGGSSSHVSRKKEGTVMHLPPFIITDYSITRFSFVLYL
jgi:hypothetical protein